VKQLIVQQQDSSLRI